MQEDTPYTPPMNIGGWLTLLGIGIVVTPIRFIAVLLPLYSEIFQGGTFEFLTTPGSEAYHPLWKPYIIGEIIGNCGLWLASLILVFLFFGKKRRFPKVYAGVALVSFLFILLDAVAILAILPDEPVVDVDTFKELIRSLVSLVIWTPYLLISKRSKATFVS